MRLVLPRATPSETDACSCMSISKQSCAQVMSCTCCQPSTWSTMQASQAGAMQAWLCWTRRAGLSTQQPPMPRHALSCQQVCTVAPVTLVALECSSAAPPMTASDPQLHRAWQKCLLQHCALLLAFLICLSCHSRSCCTPIHRHVP